MSKFLRELKKRNVIRVGVAYLGVAWLILQAADLLAKTLDLPAVTGRVVLTLLVLGFVPALVLSWIYELTPEGLKRESEMPPEERGTPRLTARKLDRILISALVAIVALLLIDLYVLSPQRPATPATAGSDTAEPASGTPKAATDRPSLAVLPFVALGASADDDYFADGMTDDIITDLSKLSGIFVISRNSSSTYKGKSVKAQQ